MMGRAQTIVCTARAQPQAKQSVAPRKNRLPNKPEKQPSNATEPVLIGYARVSRTEGQDLTPQVDALQAAGCRRIHEERASGGRWDRPELTRLLDRLAAGNVLVVCKLDRLSRSLKDLLLILERIGAAGAGFRSLTESIDTTVPAGRMMMQMLGAFAEYEREMVKERTQAGLKAARAQGRPWRATAEVHSGATRGNPQHARRRPIGGRGRPIVPGAPRDDQPAQRCVASNRGSLNCPVHATFENLAENRPTVSLGLIKIGAKVVSHGRYVTFKMAEVAVPRQMFADILSLIARLRAPPAPA
jgi:hypothetical protein